MKDLVSIPKFMRIATLARKFRAKVHSLEKENARLAAENEKQRSTIEWLSAAKAPKSSMLEE